MTSERVLVKAVGDRQRLSQRGITSYHIANETGDDIEEARPLCARLSSEQVEARTEIYARKEGLTLCERCGRLDSTGETVMACPDEDCDSSHVRRYAGGHNAAERPLNQYVCRDCGNQFREPVIRRARNGCNVNRGLAAQLADPNVTSAKDVVFND